jgi:GTPase SAR1 family protein
MKGRVLATPSFEGRHDILRRMHERFGEGVSSDRLLQQRRFVIYGLGGTGKTQLVLKFVEQAGDR